MNISRLLQEAEGGSCVAQSILGICYLDGINVEVDYGKAFQLLSAASGQGASRAVANLARMYAEGLGLPKDMSQAVRLYEKAAGAGDFFAMIELGRIYSRGADFPTDLDAALKWYSIASVQEDIDVDCEEREEAKIYVARATKGEKS